MIFDIDEFVFFFEGGGVKGGVSSVVCFVWLYLSIRVLEICYLGEPSEVDRKVLGSGEVYAGQLQTIYSLSQWTLR